MEILLLTKAGGVFGWLTALMGAIMNGIFSVTSSMGIVNIGVSIIIFTIVTRLIMLPMAYKQAKSTKVNNYIQPELRAIDLKYKGTEDDRQAQANKQAEIQAIYDKYGTSMFGGCLQVFIQFPIIIALYNVIQRIPAYVPALRLYFDNIVTAIGGASAISKVSEFAASSDVYVKLMKSSRIAEIATENNIIDFLFKLNGPQMTEFAGLFPKAAEVITENYAVIEKMNTIFGMNLATSPSAYGFTIKGLAIPILAGLSQFLSAKLMAPKKKPDSEKTDADIQSESMTKTMNWVMPLVSVYFCWSFSCAIGVYWITSAVITLLTQMVINKMVDKLDIKEIISANIAKSNAKRAKEGRPLINEKANDEYYERIRRQAQREAAKRQEKLDKAKKVVEENDRYYKLDTMADRMHMVHQYDQKKSKNK